MRVNNRPIGEDAETLLQILSRRAHKRIERPEDYAARRIAGANGDAPIARALYTPVEREKNQDEETDSGRGASEDARRYDHDG
jgi:hypothetical protein